MSDRGAAIAWRRAQHAAVCDRIERWEHGSVVFARDVPGFWTYNSVRVEGPDAGLDAQDVVAAADRLQGDLAHRHVEFEDEAAGARVRPGLHALGWRTERLVWMALHGPAPHAATSAVEIGEVAFPATRALRETWAADSSDVPEQTRSFMALEERVAARRGTRALAAWGPAGEMIGFTSFSVAGPAAEIEQVYVHAARRGSGTGGALVAAAVEVAGARTTFIVADDDGEPKRLYARLGFEPVWIQHVFTRRPPR